jgi:hypothetical protein
MAMRPAEARFEEGTTLPAQRPAEQAMSGSLVPEADSQLVLSRLLILARSDLARELTEDADPDQLIARVAQLAARLIPGSDGCVIGLAAAGNPMIALAATDPVGEAILEAETAAGEGPGADVMGRHGTLRIDDTKLESRWPQLCRRLADLGVLSMGVSDLPVTRHSRGVLMIYSSSSGAFDDVAELMLPVFASRASIALGYRDSMQTLGRTIGNRQLIGQAVGILMERHRITDEEAFQRLVQSSQNSQLKLYTVAERVVGTGEEPEDAVG